MPSKTITWDNLNSSTTADFDSAIQDVVFKKRVLLGKLNAKKKTSKGGTYITAPIEYAQANTGSYSGFQVLTSQDKEVLTTATYDWAHYYGDCSISYTDDLQNRGPAAIFDMIGQKYKNMVNSLETTMNSRLFTYVSGDTAPILGIDNQVSSTTPTSGTLGGITRNSTYWFNQTKNFTSLDNLSWGGLQGLFGLCDFDGASPPDVIISTQLIWDRGWELAEAKGRKPEGTMKSVIGATAIDFNGVPWIVDKACPAGFLYMINSEKIYLKTHGDDNFKPHPWEKPSAQMVKTKRTTWTGQLVTGAPAYLGVGYNLT